MNIRLEQPKDYREVENLTREAFWNVYRPGCLEHYVLNQYRTSPDFIPELDFVMEEDGKIIGHVMFSKAFLTPDPSPEGKGEAIPSWTFGPISIHPDYKRKGYGLKLLNYALGKAREMGVGFLCMEGNIDFYKHAGFDLASKFKIHYHDEPRDAEVPYFLAQELIPGWLQKEGVTEATYCPPKGYFVADENPEAFEAYESTFPKKEKLRLPGQLGYEEYDTDVDVRITELLRASQSWDGAELPDYPIGRPELVAIRYEFPPGKKLGWHHHDVMNYGVVQQGELTIITLDGKEKTVREGEAVVEMVGTIHHGENRGTVPVVLNMFYLSQEGQPLSVPHPEIPMG